MSVRYDFCSIKRDFVVRLTETVEVAGFESIFVKTIRAETHLHANPPFRLTFLLGGPIHLLDSVAADCFKDLADSLKIASRPSFVETCPAYSALVGVSAGVHVFTGGCEQIVLVSESR